MKCNLRVWCLGIRFLGVHKISFGQLFRVLLKPSVPRAAGTQFLFHLSAHLLQPNRSFKVIRRRSPINASEYWDVALKSTESRMGSREKEIKADICKADRNLLRLIGLLSESEDSYINGVLLGALCRVSSLVCSVHKSSCLPGAVVCSMASVAAKSVKHQRKHAKRAQEQARQAVQEEQSKSKATGSEKTADKEGKRKK